MSSRCSSSRIVAVIASNLTARVRAQAVTARQRAQERRRTSITSAASSPVRRTLDDLLWATVHQIALMLKVRVVLLLPDGDGDRGARRLPPEDMLDEAISRRRNGLGAETARPAAAPTRCPAPSGCSCRCSTGRGAVGVIGIDQRRTRARC